MATFREPIGFLRSAGGGAGRIAKVIDVGLPRPRDAVMEFSPQFRDHVTEIKRLIFSARGQVGASAES